MELYQHFAGTCKVCDRYWRQILGRNRIRRAMGASGAPKKPTVSVTVTRTGPEPPKPGKK